MTSSGEISSVNTKIQICLKNVRNAFSNISGEGNWQGESNELLDAKVVAFISEASGIISSKMMTLQNFAQKYEDFAKLSSDTQPLRDVRCSHCKTHNPSSTSPDGCHYTIGVDIDGDGDIDEYLNNGHCGPYITNKNQVDSNVSTMEYWLKDAMSIKSSFPSDNVKEGTGTEPSTIRYE